MLYHNHVGVPLMVEGAPSPADPRDDQLLIVDHREGAVRFQCFTHSAWCSLFTALGRLQKDNGPERTHTTGP